MWLKTAILPMYWVDMSTQSVFSYYWLPFPAFTGSKPALLSRQVPLLPKWRLIKMLNIDQLAQDRIKALLNPIDIPTLRSKHEQFAVELRRKDRNERYARRRRVKEDASTSICQSLQETLTRKLPPSRPELDLVAAGLHSPDPHQRLQALRTLRQLATCCLTPACTAVLELGVVERVAELCRREGEEGRKEAYWALCNLASTFLTEEVVRVGGVDVFWLGLQTQDREVLELSLLGLGNIAAESSQLRDQLLLHDLHSQMASIIGNTDLTLIPVIRAGVWALSKLVHGEPWVSMQVCQKVLPVFCAVLDHKDSEIAIESLWALADICGSGDEQRIQAVLNTGSVQFSLTHLLGSDAVMRAALKLAGKLLLGTVTQVHTMVNMGVLGGLERVLGCSEWRVRKEALWCLSNIAAASGALGRMMMEHSIFGKALGQIENENADIRLEASWLLSNLALIGRDSACIKLLNWGILDLIPETLKDRNCRLVCNMLDVCAALLLAADRESEQGGRLGNSLVTLMLDGDVHLAIEELVSSGNEEVARKAEQILQRFFSMELEDDYLAHNQA